MIRRFGDLRAHMKKHDNPTRQLMICHCGRKITISVEMVRAGEVPLRCRACRAGKSPESAPKRPVARRRPVRTKQVKAAPQVNHAPAIAPVVSKSGCGCPVEIHKGIPYKMCQPASCQALGMNQLDGIGRGYRLEPPAE